MAEAYMTNDINRRFDQNVIKTHFQQLLFTVDKHISLRHRIADWVLLVLVAKEVWKLKLYFSFRIDNLGTKIICVALSISFILEYIESRRQQFTL
ncbi:hypothetical protein ACJX0J_011819, partial [Zea mays]